jgi:hypothetical protein
MELSNFRTKQSNKTVAYLLDPEDEGIAILRNLDPVCQSK